MSKNTPIVIPEQLRERFALAYKKRQIIVFHAPCGSGKTVMARALLQNLRPLYLNAGDEDFSLEAAKGEQPFVLDDLQMLEAGRWREMLCEMLRTQRQRNFVLLSRGAVPGWLMPFQFAGMLQDFDLGDLELDKSGVKALAKASGVTLTHAELGELLDDTQGYPVIVAILMRMLSEGGHYSRALFEMGRHQMFLYFDEMIYRRFEAPLQQLLLKVAPFESFDVEMARLLTGNSRVGELVAQIQENTSMLESGPPERLTLRDAFREFLLWKLTQELNAEEQKSLFSRAKLYYELHDEMKPALDCYSHVNDQRKISDLLIKNAELHVGIGQYLEMEQYYFAMPEAEILRSPTLMAGMSMLCSLFMDFDRSEYWYGALQDFAGRLKKTDPAYRDARGRLAYLDIALPQRGSRSLLEQIPNVARVQSSRQIKLPGFSVTSMLPSIMNGGKDFCEWSKRDSLLYITMRKPVESLLGRDGVGLADCAICESFFEKDEEYQPKLLALLSHLSEIQHSGSPDIEFAAIGLLARMQLAQGQAAGAQETVENLRSRFAEEGKTRFFGNMDALLCRIGMQRGDTVAVDRWLREKAPKDDLRIWVMYRYQYVTKAMAKIANGDHGHALRILAQLLPYAQKCGRRMDELYLHILFAICYFRMGGADWQPEMVRALEISWEYRFIRPIAEHGAAVLPLLTAVVWPKDAAYLERLIAATRVQAVNYPFFLKQEVKLVEPLTASEQQVLKLLCHNMSNQEICDVLGIKLATVKTHVSRILQKLDVSRRSDVKEAAEQLDLI